MIYRCSIPLNEKLSSIRVATDYDLLVPHELILQDYSPAEFSGITFEDVARDIPAFGSHPVVRQAQAANIPCENVIPVGLYWDGIQYSNNDTVNAFYVHNMHTGRKHLWCVLRAPCVMLDRFRRWAVRKQQSGSSDTFNLPAIRS